MTEFVVSPWLGLGQIVPGLKAFCVARVEVSPG